MGRRVALILALALVLLPHPTASAQGMPLEGVCAFPVLGEVLVDQTAARGQNPFRLIVTGRLVVRVTNLSTGKSLVLNASGPTFITSNPDGTSTYVYRGRAIIALFPGEAEGPQLFVNSGQVTLTLNAAGRATQVVRQTGHKEDLCAALAS
jgi:hypothetical protein